MTEQDKLNCKFHNKELCYQSIGRSYMLSYERKDKCGCKMCAQSYSDTQLCQKISREHQYGKFCKKSNNCYRCAEIKTILREIKHFSNYKCGRACEMCHNKISKDNASHKKSITRSIMRLYNVMIGTKFSSWKF